MPKVKFYRDKRGNSPSKPVFFVLRHNYGVQPNYEIINSSVPASMWNEKAKGSPECVKGTSEEAICLRDKLKTIKHQAEVEIPDYLAKECEIPKNEQTVDQIYAELLKRHGIEVKQTKKPMRLITEYIKAFLDLHTTYAYTTRMKYKRLKETMESFVSKEPQDILRQHFLKKSILTMGREGANKKFKEEFKLKYPLFNDEKADPASKAEELKTMERDASSVYDVVENWKEDSLLLSKITYPWLTRYCNYLCEIEGYENDYIETLFRQLNSTRTYFDLGASFSLKKIMGHLKKYHGKETDEKGIELNDALKIYYFDCIMDGEEMVSWLKARDIYIWSFFSGHRHNELYALSKNNVEERTGLNGKYKVLKYVSDKTGEPNEIVLNEIQLEIIERWANVEFTVERTLRGGQKIIYNDPLLPMMSSDKCNKYLHEMLEEIAFRDSVAHYGKAFSREAQDLFDPISFYKKRLKVRYNGCVRKEKWIPMWKFVTIKTSRTSTACVLADNGVSDDQIASLLNNDPETTKKYYARRKRTSVNQLSKEVMDQAVKNAVNQ